MVLKLPTHSTTTDRAQRTMTVTSSSHSNTNTNAPPPSSSSSSSKSIEGKLRPLTKKKSVRWQTGVIDNEMKETLSSKSCCVFQKKRSFYESDTESSDSDFAFRHKHSHKTKHRHKHSHGECHEHSDSDDSAHEGHRELPEHRTVQPSRKQPVPADSEIYG
jgi:hypothetical protein